MESLITIFTPTFNRVGLLPRCYESLKKQNDNRFVWMIIDDGSTDNTRELVESWIKIERNFIIKYYYKQNEGLHSAYNMAIEKIATPLCLCVDSDDYLQENAIEMILDFWETNGSEKYAGIIGLDCFEDGNVIGDLLPNQKQINLIDLLTGKYNLVNGDRALVVRTELYKSVAPMKVFAGEKYFNPHFMHLQISESYDFLVFNEALKTVEYQLEGMSNSMLEQYRNSPKSFSEIRKLYLSFPGTSLGFKLRHSIHLSSSCFLMHNIRSSITDNPHKLLALASIPFGLALSCIILSKGRHR